MKKLFLNLALLKLVIVFTACESSMNKDVACKKFFLLEEYYWFPGKIGDSVTFVNSSNLKKNFRIVDKQIKHRNKYISDTGCSCLDESAMLLTSGTDSIWFKAEVKYLEGQAELRTEELVFVLNGRKSEFNELSRTFGVSVTFDSLSFNNAKKFDHGQFCEEVCKAYMVKNLGIIKFEMTNGEVWTNTNLTDYSTTTENSFSITTTSCY